MNIVVTDGYTLNPGDQSWDALKTLGNLTVYDRTSPTELAERCRDADIIVTNKTPVPGDAIRQLPKLQMISVTATGYNIIDIAAAREKKLIVSNVPGYGTASVAQHCFALILELSNRAGIHSRDVLEGGWQRSVDWSYTLEPITELAEKIIGIVGMGNIGRQVANIAEVFGMEVIYHTPKPSPKLPGKSCALDELFRRADIVSLHCPQTPANTGFVNKDLLATMKKTSWLINTSRGGLINESDLAEALRNKRPAAAALDVLAKEPPQDNHPLTGLPNCIITPHIAWVSLEARQRVMNIAVENVRGFVEGKPRNVVSEQKGVSSLPAGQAGQQKRQ